MSKIKKTVCIVCCLCLMVCLLAVPVNAASTILPGCYDPADYIHDITISDATKTIRYDFSDIRYAFRYWDNGSGKVQNFTDNFSVQVQAKTQHVVNCYSFGGINNGHNLGNPGCALFVGDILPGSPIDFKFGIEVSFEWVNEGQPFDMTLVYEPAYHLFDDNGVFLNTVSLEKETVVYTLGDGHETSATLTLSDIRYLSGTIPADATYILPYYKLTAKNSSSDQVMVTLSVQGLHTSLSVDINTVLENSNQMSAIQDKLDDLNVSIGGVNDKLDQILQQPEQEKSDATQGANDAFSGVVDVVPDHSAGLADAFTGLATSMSYNGTVAKLDIPAVSMPGIDGLFDGFIVMQPQELDFEVYFQMLPENLLLLVQSLFTAALIIFCFKELYNTIQYCLTLRG